MVLVWRVGSDQSPCNQSNRCCCFLFVPGILTIIHLHRYFRRLIEAYEKLDPEHGFSNLASVLDTQLTGKYKERAALDTLTTIVKEMKADIGEKQV